MFRYLYFFIRFRQYFKNDKGLSEFADRCLNWLIEKSAIKAGIYIEKNEELKDEKKNLILRSEDINKKAMLENDDFFTVRKKYRTQTFIIGVIIIAEMFLNYISTLIFINGEDLIFTFIRWGIAIVLTGGGIIVSEKLIESVLPITKKEKKDIPNRSTPVIILWSILLIGVEIAIMGVSETRATDIEGGHTGGVLYYGFIILSMVLPLIAGAARWDIMHYLDAYKNTLLHRKIQERLHKIETILRRNEEHKLQYFKIQSVVFWDIFSEFKTFKENYDKKKGLKTEDLSSHFACNNDTFQLEADKRYEKDPRTHSASHIQKLTISDKSVGDKIGQSAFQE
ncbi:MAG: hypothetical protein ACHQQQ_01775 [Bacteroidota bacterium]